MTEAVRFYWRGRDAAIPLGEIPEQDRSPLRVRRSVVHSYAPAVVKQLEEDRFVAAAWESEGAVWVILCHPNLEGGRRHFPCRYGGAPKSGPEAQGMG